MTVENCSGLIAAAGLGVIVLINRASIAGGRKGVDVMVGVSLIAGMVVIVPVTVMVGVSGLVGKSVPVGVPVSVGVGGKYWYAMGSPLRANQAANMIIRIASPKNRQPRAARWRRKRKKGSFCAVLMVRIPARTLMKAPSTIKTTAAMTPAWISTADFLGEIIACLAPFFPSFGGSGKGFCGKTGIMAELVFLKLGGSLITDKTCPYTPRLDKLADLASQIASAVDEASQGSTPILHLILGHGSGSFGHTAAEKHRTREGVADAEGWRGFAEVWHQASKLNRYVMEALHGVSLPALAFPASACVTACDGCVSNWETGPLRAALSAGLLPVVYGDVVFDIVRGGTILSTEDLFAYLALQLHPKRILLAGLEAGVWGDYPLRQRLIGHISPGSFAAVSAGIGAAAGADVTGGMVGKVEQMLKLIEAIPDLQVRIFSGEEPNAIVCVLQKEELGTSLTADGC